MSLFQVMSLHRSSATPSRRQLLAELDARLRTLSAEALRAAILGHAERLPSRHLHPFLGIFPEAAPSAQPLWQAPGSGSDSDLVVDIDAFIAHLDDAGSADEWAWDPDGGGDWDDHPGLDSAWTEEMEDLFQRAERTFTRGELDLARAAYWRLLHVFLDGHDAFADAEMPEDLVETDLTEAKACYLRALYETLPVAERAPRLLDELQQLEDIGDFVTLADVAGTRRAGLPDLDAFLPDWLVRLKSAPHYWLRYRGRSLLVEAARLHRGCDGLADLARGSVDSLPEIFLDWVDALEADGREDEAMAACREGLERVADGGPASDVRAQIADRMAVLASRRGMTQVVLEARRTAWRAGPSQRRLLQLVTAADALGIRQEVIEAEADDPGRCGSPRLASAVLLLADRVEPALARLMEAPPLGWSGSDHPGPVVVPYLLLLGAGSDAPLRRADSILGQVFGEMDAQRLFAPGPELEELMARDGDDMTPGDGTLLSGLLAARALARERAGHEREGWLMAALAVIEQRTAAVVEGKHRGAYRRVARLVVAASEALALSGGPSAGLIGETRNRYPRHTAFRRELDQAAATSSLVPSSTSQPRHRRSS